MRILKNLLTQLKQLLHVETKAPLIYGKMADIMGKISAIAKDQKNTQQNFNFRGIDDVYNYMNPLFKEARIFMTTKVLEAKREERVTQKGGTLIWTLLTVEITYFAEDGSFVQSTTQGEAMDSGDKGSNKAMSVAQKYSIIQTFAIPTKEGMPDTDKDLVGNPNETLETMKEEALKYTDAESLTEWANAKTDWHGNKEFITYVQNRIKALNKPKS